MCNRKINSELFSYYTGYFHDGDIVSVKQEGNNLSVEMESVPLYICDNRDDIPLSERNTLYGILHARGIQIMKNNKKPTCSLKMQQEYGSILRFELSNNHLAICGNWESCGAHNYEKRVWFEIEVEAAEIYWENTANITDPALLGKYMGLEGPPPYDYPQWYIDKYGPEDDEEEDSETEHHDNITHKDLNN